MKQVILSFFLSILSLSLIAQEDTSHRNEVGLSLQIADFDEYGTTNVLKFDFSRFLNDKWQVRLNSNLNFSDNFYALNSHAIGLFNHFKVEKKERTRFKFLNKMSGYVGLEAEYNKRTVMAPWDGPLKNHVLKANVIVGARYDATKRLSVFAESRLMSFDILDRNAFEKQTLSKIHLINGLTAGLKFRF